MGEIISPKWKFKGASKLARETRLSQIESELCSSEKLIGFHCGNFVTLVVNERQANLLQNAGYGKLYSNASLLHDEDLEGKDCVLSLEEAMYLSFRLQCLNIYKEEAPGLPMQFPSVWQDFSDIKSNFSEVYAAYSHLRQKRWIVRPGLQYGAQFMAYQHHPSLVHSTFAVLVISKSSNDLDAWNSIHSFTRVSGSVKKTLLLLNVICNGDLLKPMNENDMVSQYLVKEVTVRRWIPELNREIVS